MCDHHSFQRFFTRTNVKLNNGKLWEQFHENETEMIITKSGRRMFPFLRLDVTGLNPEASYFFLLEFNLSTNKRLKFNGAQWTQIGNAEHQLPPKSRLYIHPDSPAVGRHWMSQSVLFNKVKLTNQSIDKKGHVILTSMHKYLPCIHVVETSDISALKWSPRSTFSFNETEFVAVTAYQNDKVTQLKIQYNPFAKGFRETGKSRLKRKLYRVKQEGKTGICGTSRASPLKPNCSPVLSTHPDDSGISSVSSITPPISDSEDIFRPSNSIIYNRRSYERIRAHQRHHQPLSWMDSPLPSNPIIPPYCPILYPYTTMILPPPPPPPHYIYQPTLPLRYLTAMNSSNDSCLIDLSLPKRT